MSRIEVHGIKNIESNPYVEKFCRALLDGKAEDLLLLSKDIKEHPEVKKVIFVYYSNEQEFRCLVPLIAEAVHIGDVNIVKNLIKKGFSLDSEVKYEKIEFDSKKDGFFWKETSSISTLELAKNKIKMTDLIVKYLNKQKSLKKPHLLFLHQNRGRSF